ncbi:MAG: nucleotide exchange factor GrpE [Saccharofermentans sp.]|jgi:molecular chaperone GrpE|nr:nucleotide exchange factor GrpE [Saccharofermentans sp.]
MADEELFFGADDEPVKDEADNSSVEDAAASDKASAEGGEQESKEPEETKEEAKENKEEEKADDSSSELEARYMSLYAEYDNYRRRTQKEKDNLYADAIATVTKEFLTLIDNLDRAVDGAKKSDETSLDKVIQGMELVGRQAQDTLTKIGVEEIPAERGTKFDPNLHDAMMHVDDEELGEQEIAMVFAKGYKYKDRVIRHAQVQVAN